MNATAGILERAIRTDAARPRLTFYDDATGERVEMSAATLENWVSKTANLITLDIGLAPGAGVLLQLPRHWLLAIWVLACDFAGVVPLDEPEDDLELAVVGPDDLHKLPAAAETLACSLAPLGAPFSPASLPMHVRDFVADVRTMPDQSAPIGPGSLGEGAEQQAPEIRAEGAQSDAAAPPRVLALSPAPKVARVVSELIAPLAAGGSAVWVRNPSEAASVRRWEAEQITHVAEPVPAEIVVPPTVRRFSP